jgi:cell division protease FtsH
MTDFELAKDKVLMGAERRSMVMSTDERRKVAFHESGHALVAAVQKGGDPLHKVTIIPRGMALGVTQQLPLDDRYTHSRQYLMTSLAVLPSQAGVRGPAMLGISSSSSSLPL